MLRQVRIEYEGAYYHVMARGDRREAIFLGVDDRALFLDTLGQVCEKTGWRVHAWVLMSNHYHWVLETPEANLVRGMQWFQNTYTRRFNQGHRLWGHIFGSRYNAVVVESDRAAARDYLSALLDYVHLNPVRAECDSYENGEIPHRCSKAFYLFNLQNTARILRDFLKRQWHCRLDDRIDKSIDGYCEENPSRLFRVTTSTPQLLWRVAAG